MPTLLSAQRFALPALGRGRRSRPTGKMLRRRKLLEIAADSPASGARFVGCAHNYEAFLALAVYLEFSKTVSIIFFNSEGRTGLRIISETSNSRKRL